jgi:hypothetical protein
MRRVSEVSKSNGIIAQNPALVTHNHEVESVQFEYLFGTDR